MPRQLFLFIFYLLTFTSYAQPAVAKLELKPRPILTEEFERLDIEKYRKIGIERDVYAGVENGKEVYIKKIYYTKLESGKYFNMSGGGSSGYTSQEMEEGSFYQVYKEYYLNGNIKRKNITLNFSSSLIGKVYKYDEKGNLIHAFAEDTQYKFSIEQVLKYLLEVKKLPLETGYLSSSSFTKAMHIEQSEMDDKHVWLIKWEEEDPAGVSVLQKIITLFLDGDTGAFISKEEELYDPNPIMIEYPFGE